MTSNNMMDHKNPSYGCQIILSCKNTRGFKGDSNAKLAASPHWRSTVLVKQVTQRFHRKLWQARKSIHKQFPLNVHVSSVNRRSEILHAEER
jgi:hypothetical protein